ncbi:ABC transporter substrate-binding protein [Falsiroseomonas selenitidurans]|uniref:ABC transporter substrate-binding protein n=1 Tax=Falsiroseomonas selenitidurans TaxID=2716335 RepID=A0ABX1E9K2_9PROT|nr:ABC transporter substrate-binding protein [Falsiroseomonas selenitidurans]NKC33633.1 ABC transporter substrate-binding protein [Falsiroseomonas selenitidurans]
MTITRRLALGTLAASPLLAAPALRAQAPVEIVFNYPIAVGGPITRIIDGYCEDFARANPGFRVKPIYAGSYQDTLTKTLTAMRGGDAPQMACLLAVDIFTLIGEDAVLAWDDLPGTDKAWLDSFYPSFLENSRTAGKTWGVPFQRSTVVMYWNKEAFREAGLNPETPPADWAQQVDFAQKLTKRQGDATSQWGMQIPSSGFPYWLFQGLTTQNDVRLMNAEGNRTNFADPKVAEALQYWMDLSMKHRVHPAGIVEWGTTPRDFFERKVAMMWTTTGNLTNVRRNAPFPFGVGMLPAGKRRGSPTGGGNLYVFKSASAAQREGAVRFARFLTTPERAAQWGIDTGYVAVTPAAFETPAMRAHVADFPPAAVARDQLEFAVAELSTQENQRVTKALNDNLQAALTGRKPAAPAMADAQAEAERILRRYR